MFSYRLDMRNAAAPDLTVLRAVGRDRLIHAIARELAKRSTVPPLPPVEAHALAGQVADEIEQLGWQIMRPHRQTSQQDDTR